MLCLWTQAYTNPFTGHPMIGTLKADVMEVLLRGSRNVHSAERGVPAERICRFHDGGSDACGVCIHSIWRTTPAFRSGQGVPARFDPHHSEPCVAGSGGAVGVRGIAAVVAVGARLLQTITCVLHCASEILAVVRKLSLSTRKLCPKIHGHTSRRPWRSASRHIADTCRAIMSSSGTSGGFRGVRYRRSLQGGRPRPK